MAIRWVSNPESIKANQPSVLAIAETLAAMGVAVWIAVTWDTYLHIAIGASIAPLLLMRTDESCLRSALIVRGFLSKPVDLLSYMKQARKLRGFRFWKVLLIVIMPVWIPSVFVVGRTTAWVTTLLRQPLATLVAIPGNWRYATFVLDSRKWPDLLAIRREDPPVYDDLDVGDVIKSFLFIPKRLEQAPRWLFGLVVTSLLIVPAFAYRWSLKSTAIIWFPLLWGMRSVRRAGKSFPEYLSAYVRNPFSVIVLCVSIAAIVTFLAKIILLSEWSGFVAWWNGTQLRQVLSLYVAPAEIQVWQMAMFINSWIAIAMYLLAVWYLVMVKHRQITTETAPRRVFHVGQYIRPILSCYTILCMLYITIRAASDWNLPALGSKPFPWM